MYESYRILEVWKILKTGLTLTCRHWCCPAFLQREASELLCSQGKPASSTPGHDSQPLCLDRNLGVEMSHLLYDSKIKTTVVESEMESSGRNCPEIKTRISIEYSIKSKFPVKREENLPEVKDQPCMRRAGTRIRDPNSGNRNPQWPLSKPAHFHKKNTIYKKRMHTPDETYQKEFKVEHMSLIVRVKHLAEAWEAHRESSGSRTAQEEGASSCEVQAPRLDPRAPDGQAEPRHLDTHLPGAAGWVPSDTGVTTGSQGQA